MKGIIFPDSDIDIHLTEDELIHLYMIEVVKKAGKRKVQHIPIEARLQDSGGADFGKQVYVQFDHFEDMGDGIRVSLCTTKYTVRLNSHAQELLFVRGQFGSRYGSGEKITFYVSDRRPR